MPVTKKPVQTIRGNECTYENKEESKEIAVMLAGNEARYQQAENR